VDDAAAVVALRGVSVHRGVSPILRDLDLTIGPGEVVGLFGGNGAGKTTLLELVATRIRPSAGSATVLGVDIDSPGRLDIRRRIGLIGHTPALYPELTLGENLRFAAELAGLASSAVDDALATVGLAGAADRPAGACSYGMQRRSEFARELLLEPDVLLLDEPHSALDVAAVDLVAHLTDAVVRRGGAAVLVSHDRERIEKLAGRSLELVGGSLR
jgi:heme exporter protein A